MANTITTGKGTVTVVSDGATDFSLATQLGMLSTGVRLQSIMFYPNAADDVCIIRDGSDTSTIIWKFKDVAGSGGQALYSEGKDCWPYIKDTEGVSGAIYIFNYI